MFITNWRRKCQRWLIRWCYKAVIIRPSKKFRLCLDFWWLSFLFSHNRATFFRPAWLIMDSHFPNWAHQSIMRRVQNNNLRNVWATNSRGWHHSGGANNVFGFLNFFFFSAAWLSGSTNFWNNFYHFCNKKYFSAVFESINFAVFEIIANWRFFYANNCVVPSVVKMIYDLIHVLLARFANRN